MHFISLLASTGGHFCKCASDCRVCVCVAGCFEHAMPKFKSINLFFGVICLRTRLMAKSLNTRPPIASTAPIFYIGELLRIQPPNGRLEILRGAWRRRSLFRIDEARCPLTIGINIFKWKWQLVSFNVFFIRSIVCFLNTHCRSLPFLFIFNELP